MERFLLYLDNLDDWFYLCAHLSESLRRVLGRLSVVAMIVIAQLALVGLALQSPTLGAAAAALLTVMALYRSATAPIQAAPATLASA